MSRTVLTLIVLIVLMALPTANAEGTTAAQTREPTPAETFLSSGVPYVSTLGFKIVIPKDHTASLQEENESISAGNPNDSLEVQAFQTDDISEAMEECNKAYNGEGAAPLNWHISSTGYVANLLGSTSEDGTQDMVYLLPGHGRVFAARLRATSIDSAVSLHNSLATLQGDGVPKIALVKRSNEADFDVSAEGEPEYVTATLKNGSGYSMYVMDGYQNTMKDGVNILSVDGSASMLPYAEIMVKTGSDVRSVQKLVEGRYAVDGATHAGWFETVPYVKTMDILAADKTVHVEIAYGDDACVVTALSSPSAMEADDAQRVNLLAQMLSTILPE